MAIPREGSASATLLGGARGILLSPVFGKRFLSKSSTGTLALSSLDAGETVRVQDGGATDVGATGVGTTDVGTTDGGTTVARADGGALLPTVDGGSTPAFARPGAVLDSTTTVLTALFFHPMLANPNPAASGQVAEWLVAKANAGWAELQAASSHSMPLRIGRAAFPVGHGGPLSKRSFKSAGRPRRERASRAIRRAIRDAVQRSDSFPRRGPHEREGRRSQDAEHWHRRQCGHEPRLSVHVMAAVQSDFPSGPDSPAFLHSVMFEVLYGPLMFLRGSASRKGA